MGRRKEQDDTAERALAAYAVGGAPLAGAVLVGGLLGEESRRRPHDPEPIGSDPWLHRSVKAALAREPGLDASRLTIEVREAVVTLRGVVPASADVERALRAARSVQGIKTLNAELSVG